MKGFLRQYQPVSEQKIHVTKSSFICSTKTSIQMVNRVKHTLGFKQEKLPFQYLGVPLYKGRSRKILFDGNINKVKRRIFQWNSNYLITGGKIVLIRHILSSISLYVIQVLSPPKGIIKDIEKLFNAFLRDNREDRRIHWAYWERLC